MSRKGEKIFLLEEQDFAPNTTKHIFSNKRWNIFYGSIVFFYLWGW